jgi:outer membrane protein assembly factor BamB
MVHAATGRGPFDSDSPYVVAYQVVHDEPDLTGVPADLAPLMLRCLAKEPEDRPTPDELMRELRSVSASYDTQAFIPAQRTGDDPPDLPPPAPPVEETAGHRPSKGRRLRKKVLLVAGALVLVAGGVVGTVHLLGTEPVPSKGTAPSAAPAAFRAWTAKPVSGSKGSEGPVRCSYGAGKLLCARPGMVFALDGSDGGLLWQHPTDTTRWSVPPVLSGGLVQPLADHGRRLEALDPASGGTRWKRNVAAYNWAQQAGGTVLLTHADGTVTGVDGASGGALWSRTIPGQGSPAFSSFAGDPLAYMASVSGNGSSTRVTAVDPASGDVRWDARLKGSLQPVGSADGSVFFLALDKVYGDTQAVVRYDPGSRSARRVALPVPRQSVHATVRGDVVYLLATGGSLEAVDTVTGKQLWNIETSVSRGSAPVADGRHVYVSAADGRLLAVNARKGTLAGQTPARLGKNTGQVVAALPEPVIAGAHVYATAPDGTVFAVNARNPSAW